MKRKLLIFLLCISLLSAMSVTAFADMGPKPSVHVNLKNLPEGPVYGTLVSADRSTGPSSAWDRDPAHARVKPGEPEYDVWKAFMDYQDGQDPDGYWFLQEWWDCSDGDFAWTYYPPSDFKILLYFPESGAFLSSGICQRYAFDSYFDATPENGVLTVKRSYQTRILPELWGLLCRMVLTVAVELLIGLLFWPWEKDVFRLLIVVNVLTQLLLNLALNVYAYFNGTFILIYGLVYFLLEVAVMVIETLAYNKRMPDAIGDEIPMGKALGYSMVANLCSFALGLVLVRQMPWMF